MNDEQISEKKHRNYNTINAWKIGDAECAAPEAKEDLAKH